MSHDSSLCRHFPLRGPTRFVRLEAVPGPFSLFFLQGLASPTSLSVLGALSLSEEERTMKLSIHEKSTLHSHPHFLRSFVFSPLASSPPLPSILFPFYSGRVSSSCHQLPLKKKGPPLPCRACNRGFLVFFFFASPLSLHCHRLGRLRRPRN